MRRSRPGGFARVLRLCAALTLCAAAHTHALAAAASEALTVAIVQGDVRVTMNGATQALKAGMAIVPPAEIRTGADGFVELRQARTRMSVAADSQLAIPLSVSRAALIERVLQARGNVFYDVAPRSGSKLKVETPYLVASIKGTQFNVAANADSATVSLFEGRLEVWSSDGGDVVQLDAGEIATRGDADEAIRVLLMNTGELLRAGVAPGAGGPERSAASRSEPAQEEPTSASLADAGSARPVEPARTTLPAEAPSVPEPPSSDVLTQIPLVADTAPVVTQPDVASIGAPRLVLDVVPTPVSLGVEVDPAGAPPVESPPSAQRPLLLDEPISPPVLEPDMVISPPISPPILELNPGLELNSELGPSISPPGQETVPQVSPVGKGRTGP